MSLKASNIEMTVDAYRKISNIINQPLHLGITEAGSFRAGTVKSSIGVGTVTTNTSVKNSFLGKSTGVIREFTAPFVGIYSTKEIIESFND